MAGAHGPYGLTAPACFQATAVTYSLWWNPTGVMAPAPMAIPVIFGPRFGAVPLTVPFPTPWHYVAQGGGG